MPKITDINEAESIRTGRLIFKRGFFYYFDKLFACFFSAAMFACGMFALNTKVDGEFTDFCVYVISPVLIIGGLYCMYRVFTENKLLIVKTGFLKSKNHEVLKEFLYKYHYQISHSKGDIVIAIDYDELSSPFAGSFPNRKDYTFIIDDLTIYFTAIQIKRGTAFPTLFAHLIMKHDLVKFISKWSA